MYNIKDILRTQSVAVVGASNDENKMGYTLLHNIVQGGFKGKVYPVNKKEKQVQGIRAYAALNDIESPVDLIVICVPAFLVPSVLKEAAAKKVKGAIIISGGFKEKGEEELEKEVVKIAEESNIRIIGPNCQGVNYRGNDLCATWPLVTGKGGIGIVSQSGTIGAAIELWAEEDGLGISCFAALGNKSDVTEYDFLRFFTEDEDTKVVALNIEGVSDGKDFEESITYALEKKPVIILKPGRTERGAVAVSSHTKSIAGNDKIFDAFCEKKGLIRAKDLTSFYDGIKLFSLGAKHYGKRVLIITSSGGAGILATDSAMEYGFHMPDLSEEIKAELAAVLPSQCVLSNPLDVTGDATSSRYADVMKVIEKYKTFDVVLCIFGDPIPGVAEAVATYRDAPFTLVGSYLGGGSVEKEETLKLHEKGIAVFPTPERAIAAISFLQMRKVGS